MLMLATIVVATVVVSFFASTCEAVLYSTRMGTLEACKASGSNTKAAEHFLAMKKKIAVPIGCILIVNTIANTAGATMAGFYAADVFGAPMVTLFSVAFTLLILFIGEIMPKTLGAVYWRSLWPVVVWPLHGLKYALFPAVFVTQKFANLFIRGKKQPQITTDEILAAVRIGASEGEITAGESELVHNIIELESKAVRDIMTPRTVIFSLEANMTVEEAVEAVDGMGFTRIPIYEGDREIHDLYSAKAMAHPQRKLKSLARNISFTPATTNALALLTQFLKHRRHISVVIDEYGGVAGLITLEDLIETLLGKEIVDETDREIDLQERARRIRSQNSSKN
ncbi:MAG: CNNM domain-containing protein [Desulfomonilaceae bacterium]